MKSSNKFQSGNKGISSTLPAIESTKGIQEEKLMEESRKTTEETAVEIVAVENLNENVAAESQGKIVESSNKFQSGNNGTSSTLPAIGSIVPIEILDFDIEKMLEGSRKTTEENTVENPEVPDDTIIITGEFVPEANSTKTQEEMVEVEGPIVQMVSESSPPKDEEVDVIVSNGIILNDVIKLLILFFPLLGFREV